MKKLVLALFILSIFTVGFRIQPTRYVSDFKIVSPYQTVDFNHDLTVRPTSVDAWCADIFEAPTRFDFPVAPCYDYPGTDLRIISVTAKYVTVYNFGPSRTLVQVVVER